MLGWDQTIGIRRNFDRAKRDVISKETIRNKKIRGKRQYDKGNIFVEASEKDVKEWAMSDATIDKYKERYKEIWREKLDEVVKRMMDKI